MHRGMPDAPVHQLPPTRDIYRYYVILPGDTAFFDYFGYQATII